MSGAQPAQEQKKAEQPAFTVQMAEAGFSINVKMVDPNGSEVMLTFRAPMASHADKLLEYYSATIKRLIDAGWRVLANGARSQAQAQGGGQTSGDAPTCQFHGPMKKSNHGGFYCPKKMGDGSYCKEKAV